MKIYLFLNDNTSFCGKLLFYLRPKHFTTRKYIAQNWNCTKSIYRLYFEIQKKYFTIPNREIRVNCNKILSHIIALHTNFKYQNNQHYSILIANRMSKIIKLFTIFLLCILVTCINDIIQDLKAQVLNIHKHNHNRKNCTKIPISTFKTMIKISTIDRTYIWNIKMFSTIHSHFDQ